MLVLRGSIWELAQSTDAVVIPMNVGWRQTGTGILGAGLALQAKQRWPLLEPLWGEHCQVQRKNTAILAVRTPDGPCGEVLLFPTKPLNTRAPHLSWQGPASLSLIEWHLLGLAAMAREAALYLPGLLRVLVPLLGCGEGQLQKPRVVGLIEQLLRSPMFVRVELSAAKEQP